MSSKVINMINISLCALLSSVCLGNIPWLSSIIELLNNFDTTPFRIKGTINFFFPFSQNTFRPNFWYVGTAESKFQLPTLEKYLVLH